MQRELEDGPLEADTALVLVLETRVLYAGLEEHVGRLCIGEVGGVDQFELAYLGAVDVDLVGLAAHVFGGGGVAAGDALVMGFELAAKPLSHDFARRPGVEARSRARERRKGTSVSKG